MAGRRRNLTLINTKARLLRHARNDGVSDFRACWVPDPARNLDALCRGGACPLPSIGSPRGAPLHLVSFEAGRYFPPGQGT
jgi:hypothetical protein